MAAGLLVASAPARAHEETSLHGLSIIESVSPDVDGVSFRVAHLTQPVLVATNRTDEPLVVLGGEGEPFLRIHHGRIEANARSELTYVSRSPEGMHARSPGGLDPLAEPVWRVLARGHTWSWFDPRMRRLPDGPTEWVIDARVGANAIEIRGGFEPFEGHGHFRTSLDPIDGKPPKLDIRLLDGLVPAFFVRSERPEELLVRGRANEPFLRVGPKGVFANLESPDFYLGGGQTIRDVPPGTDPRDPPRWRKLSSVPTWTWLEYRARLPAEAHFRERLGDEQHVVLRWTTPMALGNDPLTVRGSVEWIPPVRTVEKEQAADGQGYLGWLAALAIAVAIAAAVGLRRLPK